MSKVCLVTGATQGIGESIAHLLASQGWTVVVSGRNKAKGDEVVRAIKEKGDDAFFIQADIGVEEEVKSLHEQILAKYGKLDAAVNNAGISNEYGKLADLSTAGLENQFRVNVFGVFWAMQWQIKAMLPKKFGRIVNIASVGGLHGIAGNCVYSSTKHAVIGLTRSAALDYATDGINITAVAPAVIRTELIDATISSGFFSEEDLRNYHPMKKLGDPIDVAKAVSFLLDSPFVTGSVLEVDGGIAA